MKKYLLIILLLFSLLPAIVSATALSDLADSMSAGEFAELTGMTNFSSGGILNPPGCSGGDQILQYANTAVWNSVAKRFQFSGSPHVGCTGTNERAVYYDDATNTWGVLPLPPSSGNDPRHSYGHNAIDGAGNHYYTHYNSLALYRLANGAGSWTTLAARTGFVQCCRSQAWFPDWNSGSGGLLHVDGDWGGRIYNPGTNSWTQLWQGNGGDGSGLPQYTGAPYPALAFYSERCQCVMFGGGANWRKLNSDGSVTTLSRTNGPSNTVFNIGVGYSSWAVDPVSGFLIVLTSGEGSYQFDPGTTDADTGTWGALGATIPTFFSTAGSVAESLVSAPIPDYGVIMYVKHNDSNEGRVYLYKHAASAASADADFAARCAAAGVLRCVGFDDAADIAGDYGDNTGILTGIVGPDLDTAVKASGASSLRFTVSSQSGSSGAGSYFANFTSDLSQLFGSGDTFYIQWRQRMEPLFLDTASTGGGGWKQVIIGEGDVAGVCNPAAPLAETCPTSCTQLEIVLQNTNEHKMPQMYHSCGIKDGQYEPLDWIDGSSNIYPQYAVSGIGTGCQYPGPYAAPQCKMYRTNEWQTYTIQVTIGTWYQNDANYQNDSTVKLWVANEGEASTLVLDRSPGSGTGYDLVNLDSPPVEYGKVWLLPYQGGKDDTVVHPVTYTWYDELIISTQPIADPSGAPPSEGGDGIVFAGAPTGLSTSSAANPAFAGASTGLSTSSAANPAFAGAPTGLSTSSAANPTFAGAPTGLQLQLP